jgi:hypothetical protein
MSEVARGEDAMAYRFSRPRFTTCILWGFTIGLALAAVVYPWPREGGEPSLLQMFLGLFSVLVLIFGTIPLRLLVPGISLSLQAAAAFILINWMFVGAMLGLLGGFFPAKEERQGR